MADFNDLWANGAKGVASAALENHHQARASAGVLYGLDGWCNEAGTAYVCVFDSASAVSSANPPATWPKHIIEVPAGTNFGLTLPPVGEYYANGIYVGVSTTALPNYTESAASKTHVNVQSGPIFGSNEP